MALVRYCLVGVFTLSVFSPLAAIDRISPTHDCRVLLTAVAKDEVEIEIQLDWGLNQRIPIQITHPRIPNRATFPESITYALVRGPHQKAIGAVRFRRNPSNEYYIAFQSYVDPSQWRDEVQTQSPKIDRDALEHWLHELASDCTEGQRRALLALSMSLSNTGTNYSSSVEKGISPFYAVAESLQEWEMRTSPAPVAIQGAPDFTWTKLSENAYDLSTVIALQETLYSMADAESTRLPSAVLWAGQAPNALASGAPRKIFAEFHFPARGHTFGVEFVALP